jgi:lipoprotein-anchoring transpeptidase ErfK/SrfK
MNRLIGGILLALPLVAAMMLPAQAQSNRPALPPVVHDTPQLPPGSYIIDEDDNTVPPSRDPRLAPTPRGVPGYQEHTDALPPPGFAPPYERPLNAGQPPAADGDYAIRPPGAIGNAPQAAPPQGTQQLPPAVSNAPQSAPQPPPPAGTAALPPEDQPEQGQPKELPENLRRQLVDFTTKEPAGTIIVDTANTYLYLVLGGGKAMRYGVRVGRDGFTWTGTERISRMKEWPDWFPPAEMIERQPYLPRMMAGGPGNPLGARAMYLGHTLYRIHGTNQPSTIGHYVSSGCVGMLNDDVEDLYSRVQVGTRVVVLPGKAPETAANTGAPGASASSASVMVEPAAAPGGAGVSSRPLPPVR